MKSFLSLRFYLSTFRPCLILVSCCEWLWEGRKLFLPLGSIGVATLQSRPRDLSTKADTLDDVLILPLDLLLPLRVPQGLRTHDCGIRSRPFRRRVEVTHEHVFTGLARGVEVSSISEGLAIPTRSHGVNFFHCHCDRVQQPPHILPDLTQLPLKSLHSLRHAFDALTQAPIDIQRRDGDGGVILRVVSGSSLGRHRALFRGRLLHRARGCCSCDATSRRRDSLWSRSSRTHGQRPGTGARGNL